MARQPDPDLEDRILNAARKLWKKGAAKALTMRAVARAGGTKPTRVYRRFPHREDIRRALLQRTRQELFQQLAASPSVEEACERYLDYALSHPHEYDLYYLHEYELLFSAKPARGATLNQIFKQKRPAVELMKGKLAAQLGGSPGNYGRPRLALWGMVRVTLRLSSAATLRPPQ